MSLTDEEVRECLLAWQEWWQNHGADWYLDGEHSQSRKPPFLVSGHRLYGKWLSSPDQEDVQYELAPPMHTNVDILSQSRGKYYHIRRKGSHRWLCTYTSLRSTIMSQIEEKGFEDYMTRLEEWHKDDE